MGWTKGKKRGVKPPGSGRKKGRGNVITPDVRTMVLGALEAVGGQKYLELQARENARAFLPLLAKTMPTQVQAEVEHTGGVSIEVVTGFSSGPHQR